MYQYHSNNHLLRAYNKYGKEAFEVEILEQFQVIEYNDLLTIENQYINKFHTCDSKYGYNKRENFIFPELSESSIQKHKIKQQRLNVKIIAFHAETGKFYKEFDSITQAAIYLNDQTTNISKCCKSLTRTCKGYTFIKSIDYDPTKCYKKINIKRS